MTVYPPAEVRLRTNLKADPISGCHVWTASVDGGGYGRLMHNGRRVLAHRFAYELVRGPIPGGLVIDHLCRNRRCCNPDHLEVVTFAENVLRGEGAPAKNARRTHCVNGHALSGANLRVDKRGGRVCRTCHARTCNVGRQRRLAARSPMERALAKLRGAWKRFDVRDTERGVEILRPGRPALLLTHEAARDFNNMMEEARNA